MFFSFIIIQNQFSKPGVFRSASFQIGRFNTCNGISHCMHS